MTVANPTEVVLRAHRSDVSQPPSSLLEVRPARVRELGEGEVLVENLFQQIVAVNADLMFADPGLPLPAFGIDQPLYGSAVGRVVESRADPLLWVRWSITARGGGTSRSSRPVMFSRFRKGPSPDRSTCSIRE